ncbi:nucleotidyltransferase domain-containing protein [Miltoncostaea oceani]|uniref:nucleotidyltransferase domain-containing protein n=1 Tax=Miltoncostaea oceani TaxID=2843216 RepID=UPI001C3DAC46|nr:nucleotidyltransferase domain-containing protein [Miltoncostaea oceani]
MGRGRSHGSLTVPNGTSRPGEVDHAALIRSLPVMAGQELPLVALVGSHAYGLATPESDHDYRGLYLAPTRQLLGLTSPVDQLEMKDPDICCFELEKFCRLCLAANPNVLEILWAEPVIDSPLGRRLREMRFSFLSEKVRTTYTGYAVSQLKRALATPPESPRRREKAVRHLFRLYEQVRALLETGDMQLRVADPDRLRAYARLDDAQLNAEFERMFERVKSIPSALAPEPARAEVEAFLIEVRLDQLHREGGSSRPPDES